MRRYPVRCGAGSQRGRQHCATGRRNRARPRGREFEIVYVNDGSSDGTEAELASDGHASLSSADQPRPFVRAVGRQYDRRDRGRSPLVVTLDGDGQNDPAFLPAMIAPCCRGATSDWSPASASAARRPASRNCSRASPMACAALCCATATRDTGCGLKAFRARRVPEVALFRRPAPVPSGADAAGGLRRSPMSTWSTARAAWGVELRTVGPAVGRHSRSCGRVVADPSEETHRRSRRFQGMLLISRTQSAAICTTSSLNFDWWVVLGLSRR